MNTRRGYEIGDYPQINQAEVVRMEIGVEVIKLKDTENLSTTPTTFTVPRTPPWWYTTKRLWSSAA